MHCKCCFSLVNILGFSFQYCSQWNHFTWEMICSFIFSDWLMSPGYCQIRICYPIFPTTRLATGSKVCWMKGGKSRFQLSSWGLSSRVEWKIRSWMDGFRKQIKKKKPTAKISNEPKPVLWYSPHYICANDLCYRSQYYNFLFLLMATG